MLKPIKNNQQYENALEHAYSLMQKDLKIGSKESDDLEVLFILITEYENEYHPIENPTPIEAIKFRLDQMNMSESELSTVLGYRSGNSGILSGKRKLNLDMIRKLAKRLHIAADVLIQAYR